MLLVIDVGNSHVVLGVYNESQLVGHWRIKTDKDCTADELSVLLHGLLFMADLAFEHLSGSILACVVPPMRPTWVKMIAKHLGKKPLIVGASDLNVGMPIHTDNPSEVGADRIVNAVAAYEQYRSALIVVDFGTATTFDCVSKAGAYLGGVIAPGIAISLDALFERAAKLPRIDIATPPERAIGKNTIEAIKSGILYGYAGLVDGLSRKIKEELAPEVPKILATGGLAELIAPYTESIEAVAPFLTLEGLRILYARNH